MSCLSPGCWCTGRPLLCLNYTDLPAEGLTITGKHGTNKQYTVVTPQLPPVAGAVLYALEHLGLPVTKEMIHRLQEIDAVQK